MNSVAKPAQQKNGPDRDLQKQVLRRFIQITLGRLDRMREDLADDQQLFLDALPVLLHCNHPDFPCFVSDNTPCGISKYQPSGAELQKLHTVVPNLVLSDTKNDKPQLLGLYLTGDCGTIIESPRQNIIVWLCHDDNLASNEMAQLHRKCGLIEAWAQTLNLNVCFRIFDSRFRCNNDLHNTNMHCCELDLFYRSAVLVAGRIPLWWLIPPEEEARYEQFASILRHKKYVNDDDVIDLGGLQDIPPSEHVRNGINLLSDIEKQPYEICLKQAITEIYISEQPDALLLSRQFKQAVYQDNLDMDALDPYIMVYRRIEQYLGTRQEHNRLELIRRCFYFQVDQQLSQHSSQPNWQRKLMEKLTREWGWQKDKLKILDSRQSWTTEQVKQERLELVKELNNSYRFLSEFARNHRDQIHSQLADMHILGRKLHSWYERKAGKVDLINLDISSCLHEDNLYFCQVKHRLQTVWAVYAEPVNHRDTPNSLPLRRSDSLVELATWCHLNDISNDKTRMHVVDGDHQLDNKELQNIVTTIRQVLPTDSPLLKPDSISFNQPARPTSVLMFVNVGVDSGKALSGRDQKILAMTTAFDYQQQRNNIIHNIETLTTNSWGEVVCKTFSGSIALLNCIKDYMQSVPANSSILPPRPTFFCFNGRQSKTIKKRLDELFRDLLACYYSNTMPANTRYILEMKNQFFIIQHDQHRIHFRGARNSKELIKRLGQLQTEYSPVLFDRHAMVDSALAAICPTMTASSLQIYFQPNADETATVYVIDEKGSIHCRVYPFSDPQNLLKPLDAFLQSTLYRQSTSESLSSGSLQTQYHFINTDVLYYEIQAAETAQQTPRVVPFELQKQLSNQRYLNVQAIAEAGPNNKPIFNLYCDQQEFSAIDWGTGLYPAVARFIMSRRKSGGNYPCYISDLDLSSIGASDGSSHPQTIDYLRYKEEIENGINEALARL